MLTSTGALCDSVANELLDLLETDMAPVTYTCGTELTPLRLLVGVLIRKITF